MTAASTEVARTRGLRLRIVLLLLPLGLAHSPAGVWVDSLHARVFDAYQWIAPRQRQAFPVVVVAIDDHSLERLGQWPWPRLRVAALIDAIAHGGALAVGIDMLFLEPDRLSPENYTLTLPEEAREDIEPTLARLPRHDPALAASLGRVPSVLAVALERGGARSPGRPASPVLLRESRIDLPAFAGSHRSLPSLESGASSVAMINADTEDGIIRRIPLLGQLGRETFANLGVETLRLAIGAGPLEVREDGTGQSGLQVGEARVPVDGNGRLWLWWSARGRADDPDALPVVSAADVLGDSLNPETFRDRIVLVGHVAQGQLDRITTVHRDQRPGVHAHAEIIESVVDGTLLLRPWWAVYAEQAGYLLVAGSLALALHAAQVRKVLALAALPLAALPVGGFLAFRHTGVLLDGLVPTLGAVGYGVLLLAMQLASTRRARRELETRLQLEREAQARTAGELAAAGRIQSGLLPKPSALAGARGRIEVASHMTAARTVGGDLYDYQLIEPARLFVSIGDVSDKGVPASLFMALTQSLLRSAVRRHPQDLPRAVTIAAEELDRDNPEGMFVTWVGLTLELDTGRLCFLNAGHEYPFLGQGDQWALLSGDSGPPLCALPDYPWEVTSAQWPAGATLLLYTDGLTEAQAPDGSLYGRARLAAFLASRTADAAPQALVDELLAEVARFADGRDLPDDLALVAVRYHGQGA